MRTYATGRRSTVPRTIACIPPKSCPTTPIRAASTPGRPATRSTHRRSSATSLDDPSRGPRRSPSGSPAHGNVSCGRTADPPMGPDPGDRLVDELGPVAVRRVGVEPVGEDEPGRRRPGVDDGRLDEVRLDRAVDPRTSRTRTPSRSSAPTISSAGAAVGVGNRRHRHDGVASDSGAGFFRPSMPVVEPEPLADERQEPRPALVRRRDERELQPRQRGRRVAGQPAADRGPQRTSSSRRRSRSSPSRRSRRPSVRRAASGRT